MLFKKNEKLKNSYKLKCQMIFFILISLCISCIPQPKDVGNLPIPKSKLVINNLSTATAIIDTQNVYMGMIITKTFSLFSYDSNFSVEEIAELAVSNLKVKIVSLKNNQVTNMIASPVGFYFIQENNSFFENYQDYELIVTDTENNEYKATTKFLPTVTLNRVYIDSTLLYDGERVLPEIHFEFNDIPNIKNYYLITARLVPTEVDLVRELTNYDGGFTLLDDSELFDGQIKSSFKITTPRKNFKIGDDMVVALANITKEYYDYLKDYSSKSGSTSALNEPYNIESNISGEALGFFSLHKTILRTVKISPPR